MFTPRTRLTLCAWPAVALLLSGFVGSAAAQISGTWLRTGGVSGSWSEAGNWVGSTPTAGSATVLVFGSTTNTTTVNQDLAATLVLNRLSFSNLASAGVSSFTFTGGTLRFEGDGAAITAPNFSATQSFYNQIAVGSASGLQINTAGAAGFVFYGDITNSHNGAAALTLNGGGTTRVGLLHGQIGDGAGTLSLLKAQGSSYYLTNADNTFSGNVTITGGTLFVASLADVGQASALGRGNAVFLGGTSEGTLSLSSGDGVNYSSNRHVYLNSNAGLGGTLSNHSADPNSALTLSGGVVSTSAVTLRVLTLSGSNTGANAVYSTIGNGSGQLGINKRGAGLWIIGGTNSFSGGTSIVAGALRVTNFAANLGAGNVRLLAAFSTQGVLEAAGTLTAGVGLGAGQISWGAGGGFAAGATDLTVRLNNGVAALAWASGSFVGDGQELQLGSATSQATVTLENSLNLADGARSIRVFNGAADVDAVISGSLFSNSPAAGSLSKGGLGTLRLTADNTYSGFTTIEGTLILGDNGASGNLAGAVYTRSGGILAFNRNDLLTFTSAVTGSGGVRVLSGTVNLSGANTFTGGTTVHAGATLRIRGSAWPTAGDMTVAGGTLTFTDTAARAVMQTFVTDGGVVNVFNSTTTLTRLDLGQGELNLQTADARVQTLTLGNGATVTISTGRTLVALTNAYGGPADLSNAPQIHFQGGGTEGALITGPGALLLSGTNVWLQVDDSAAEHDLTIEASITKSGSHGASKYGGGTLYLPGANPNLKNDLSLINGAVVIGDDRSLGDAEFRFATNSSRTDLVAATTAALRTDGVAAYTLTNNIALANLLHYQPLIAGSGDLTLSGAVTNHDDGQTLLLSLDAGRTLTLNRLVLSNDGTAKHLTVGGTGLSVIKQIDGGTTATVASSLTFNGTGTVVLTGNNGYRGATTIQSGTVRIAAGGAITSPAAVAVASGATLVVEAGGVLNAPVTTMGDYVLNGRLNGNATINAGGTLGGSGVVDGVLSGAGTVRPGNSPGILDVAQVDPTSDINFLFEFTLANAAPDYLNRTASGNDVLHITHNSFPFLEALDGDNKITIDFGSLTLNDGDFFLGGFFTNLANEDFIGMISNADFEFLVNDNPLDQGVWQIGINTIEQPTVDFGNDYGGEVNGRVMRIQVNEVQAVPEPGSMILCSLAAGGYWWRRRKRMQQENRAADPSHSPPRMIRD